jgi:hypothetical protein
MGMKIKNEKRGEDVLERALQGLIPTIIVLLVIVLASYITRFYSTSFSQRTEDWGTLGDYFGGLMNPVISFATLIVAYAVWKQQKVELSETKDALEDQAKTAEANRREQRFFDLLRVYQQTLDNTSQAYADSRQGSPRNGKEALDLWMEITSMAQVVSAEKTPLTTTQISSIKQRWSSPETSNKFSHYFRVINRILLDAENLLQEDQYKFIRLFRAQLSQTELRLIGLNLWLNDEGKKMRSVVEKYGLLKHLPQGKLRQKLEDELSPAVFGRKFAKAKNTNAEPSTSC